MIEKLNRLIYLPLVISLVFHSIILLLLSPFFSPKTDQVIQSRIKNNKIIHAVIMNQSELTHENNIIPKSLPAQSFNPKAVTQSINSKMATLSKNLNPILKKKLSLQNASEKPQYQQLNKDQRIIYEYQTKILKAIAAQRVLPHLNSHQILYCIYSIYLDSQGNVLGAELVQSSGNSTLDQAAKQAIYKASPLPVPADPVNFAPFRHFNLQLVPSEMLH
jgi:colicin import membrane protein